MSIAIVVRPWVVTLKDMFQYVQDNAGVFQAIAKAVLFFGTVLGMVTAQLAMASAAVLKNAVATPAKAQAEAAGTTATYAAAAANNVLNASNKSLYLSNGLIVASLLALAYILLYDAGSPGLITILGMTALAFVGLGIAVNAFGFSISGALPFILAFAAAVLMVGAGIGMASTGLAMMVSSLSEFGTGLAESMLITAMAIKSIVEDINELDTVKTIALSGAMVATAVAAPAAALAAVGTAAVTRGAEAAGAGGAAPAGAPAPAAAMGPPPVININLQIDGTEFAAVVNSVEVEKYAGGKPSKLYSTVIDMIEQGFVKGT